MANTKAFLLAAGLGTRLRPLTSWVPKCLITVAGRPMVSWWLDLLHSAGIQLALINTHSHADRVREFIHMINPICPVQLHESYEPTLLGSAGAITANPTWANDTDDVILINADNFSNVDLRALLAYHRSHSDPATMMLYRAENPRACGIAELDEDHRVVSFVEKPLHPQSDLANAGVYVVRAELYREIVRMGAFDLGHDVLPRLVGRMRGWLWNGYHKDIGTPEALFAARQQATTLTIADSPVTAHLRPAVFLDRDGTIIENVPYLSNPEEVSLLPGAAEAIRTFSDAGFACVVVTNQSGIGRGYYTEADMHRVNDRMIELLGEQGARLDGLYYCAVAPEGRGRITIDHPWRKPGPGMLLQAAQDLELDLSQSWMIGDLISDVLAGRNAGCRGSLILGDLSRKWELDELGVSGTPVTDLGSAARVILNRSTEDKWALATHF